MRLINFDKLSINIKIYSVSLAAWLFTLLLCSISLFTYAQRQEFTLQGVTFRKNATQRLAKVLVADAANSAIVTTDDLGVFTIKCAIGDTLLFRQKDYTDQKVAVASKTDLMVYMIPTINLMEVDIKDATKKQQLAGVMKEYHSQGIYNNGKTSVLGAVTSPLNALYDAFGSGAKQARRFNKYSSTELEQTEVDRRFSRKLIKQLTNINDDKMQLFMDAYRPSYSDIKQWNDYDLISYIKRSYKDFELNSERPPVLQKLLKDTVKLGDKH